MTETKKPAADGIDVTKEIETIVKLPEAERPAKTKELQDKINGSVHQLVDKALEQQKADDAKTKEAAQAAPHAPEAPGTPHDARDHANAEAGHTPHEAAAYAPAAAAKTPEAGDNFEDSAVAYSPKDIALKVVAPTLAVSAAAAAAANGAQVLTPLGLATSPTALATYTWLQNAVQSIPLIGPWIPTGGGILSTLGATAMIAPVVGAGLYGIGKISNTIARLWNKDHPNSGLNPFRNMLYGIQAPFMLTKYLAQKTYENVIDPLVVQPAIAVKDWTKANTDTLAKGAGVGILVGTALGMATAWPPFGVLAAVAAGGSYIAQNARHGQAHGNGKKNGHPEHDAAAAGAHPEPHPEPAH